jgi:hypothetical protein
MTATSATPAARKPRIAKDKVLIHFVEDGVTAFGYVWTAGQELELDRNSEEFKQTQDANGTSWMDMTEKEQVNSKGSVKWRKGPSSIPNPIINFEQHPNEHIDFYGVSSGGVSYLTLKNKEAAAQKEIERGRGLPSRDW